MKMKGWWCEVWQSHFGIQWRGGVKKRRVGRFHKKWSYRCWQGFESYKLTNELINYFWTKENWKRGVARFLMSHILAFPSTSQVTINSLLEQVEEEALWIGEECLMLPTFLKVDKDQSSNTPCWKVWDLINPASGWDEAGGRKILKINIRMQE